MSAAHDAEFAAYFEARRDHVRRTAYLLTSDWHKADDLAQTAFVKLYGAWQRIRDQAAMDAHVRSCLVRAVVDDSRRPWRREKVVELMPERADTAESDVASLIADRELFRQALADVPQGQRTVLVLRYYEGLDVAGAAAAMGLSEGTVESQTARGLVALRRALERRGVDTPDDRRSAGGDRL